MTGMDGEPFLDIAQPRLTAHEFVYDTLRRAILGGALPGGAHLVQADIASRLSVSTTPVREALRDLAAEGLVVFRPHIGAVVRELNMTELAELYDIRKALEPLAIRRAAERITPDELAEATALARQMETESDPATWAVLNRKFHQVLEDAAQAPFIQSVLRGVQDISAIYVARSLVARPARMNSGNKQHRGLIAALRRHDGDAAAAQLVAHLDATLQTALAVSANDIQPAPAAEPARTATERPATRSRRAAPRAGARQAGR
jgi:DNA-binding GntR family transcriptional regulator